MVYEITLSDYLQAQRLHARWRDRDIRARNIIWGLMLVGTVVLILFKNYVLAGGLIGGIMWGDDHIEMDDL